MKIRHLSIVPALFLVACGGSSTPEPETPASEAAGAAEAAPAEKPAEEAKPAEGGEAAPAADAPAAEEKK